jgi:Carbamoylphosphate synthase small subunit
VAGFIIRDESPVASNWRAEMTLRDYLVANKIVAISTSIRVRSRAGCARAA